MATATGGPQILIWLQVQVLQASRLKELEQDQLRDHLKQELKDQEEQHFRGFGPETRIPGRLEICQDEDGAIVMIGRGLAQEVQVRSHSSRPGGMEKEAKEAQARSLSLRPRRRQR